MKKGPRKSIDIEFSFTEKDIDQVFELVDPLIVRSKSYQDSVEEKGVFDPIDYPFIYGMKNHFLLDIIENYFRAELIGFEKIDPKGPAIIGCNHSGTAFPHDALVLDGLMWAHDGYKKEQKCRSVYSPKLAKVWWMRPYGIDNFWRRGGAVDMTFINFDRLLAHGDRVLYYPEGVPGIGKGFTRRYQLQHFYSSFVLLAAKHNAPFYPVVCVNAEWVNPTSLTLPWLDSIIDRWLGIPFFPIPAGFIGLIFPFFFYLAFPCKMKFLVGDSIDINALLKEEGVLTVSRPNRQAVDRVAARIRKQMQRQLNEGVKKYGKHPYDWKSLFAKIKKQKWRFFRSTPLGWPFVFVKEHRNAHRKKGEGWKDWDLIFYFLPFGWLFLSLLRMVRSFPYGYRDLTKEEKKMRTGSYFWSLATHPLPDRKDRF